MWKIEENPTPFSRDSREFRDFRDSRDSSSEKTPFVMTPFSGPENRSKVGFKRWGKKFSCIFDLLYPQSPKPTFDLF